MLICKQLQHKIMLCNNFTQQELEIILKEQREGQNGQDTRDQSRTNEEIEFRNEGIK